MPSDTQELFSEVACYSCYGFSEEQLLTLAELKRWLLNLNPSADTTVNGLLAQTPCLGCYNFSLFQMVELALLNAIAGISSAVGDFVARAGLTNATQIAAVAQLYMDAVDHGWWDLCDCIYPFVGGTAQAHSQNLKSGDFGIVWGGTVTHDSTGITGNGTTGYGNTQYVLATSGQYATNSAHIGLYVRNPGTGAGVLFTGAVSTVNNLTRYGRVTATTRSTAINEPLSSNVLSVTNAWNVLTRLDALFRHLYHGTTNSAVASGSDSVATVALPVLAFSNVGVITNFSSPNLSGMTVGSGITFAVYESMRSDWQTFQTTLGRQI